MNHNHYFQTSCLIQAATLVYNGYNIKSIDKTDPRKVIFHIERDQYLDELLQAYYTSRLSCEPLRFANTLKALKTRIYSNS